MRRAFGGHNQLRTLANWTTLGDDSTPPWHILMTKMGKPAFVATKWRPGMGVDSGGDGGRWRENRPPQRWGTVEKGLWMGMAG